MITLPREEDCWDANVAVGIARLIPATIAWFIARWVLDDPTFSVADPLVLNLRLTLWLFLVTCVASIYRTRYVMPEGYSQAQLKPFIKAEAVTAFQNSLWQSPVSLLIRWIIV